MILTTSSLTFAGFSVILAGAVAAMTLAVVRLGPVAAWRWGPAIALIAIFVAVTHLPVPPPDTVVCGVRQTRPLFTAFRFLTAFAYRWDIGLSWQGWLAELAVSATALNLHACIAIGAALALCLRRWTSAVALGAAMTGLIELSQKTAVFGLFACPWRQFDVDDVILNTTGAALGFAAARLIGVRAQSTEVPRDG